MKLKLLRMTVMLGLAAMPFTLIRTTRAQEVKTVIITAKKFSYDPGTITLKKGQPVTLILKSEDVAHGLRFSEFNVNLKVQKGGTTQTTFTPDKTGTFIGHCSVFCGSGHGSMAITLHVVE